MAGQQLNKHDKIHHELFDEDTAQVGSLGDIVEQHAGDAVFLTPPEKSTGGADGGYSDWEAEMNETDPAPNEGMDPDDLYSAEDETEVTGTNQTGTVEGIARGFGTHLPQDIGRGGFQVEELPDAAMKLENRPAPAEGEELDDYDDDAEEDDTDLNDPIAAASEPFANRVPPTQGHTSMPDQIPVKTRRADTTDEELDATQKMK